VQDALNDGTKDAGSLRPFRARVATRGPATGFFTNALTVLRTDFGAFNLGCVWQARLGRLWPLPRGTRAVTGADPAGAFAVLIVPAALLILWLTACGSGGNWRWRNLLRALRSGDPANGWIYIGLSTLACGCGLLGSGNLPNGF